MHPISIGPRDKTTSSLVFHQVKKNFKEKDIAILNEIKIVLFKIKKYMKIKFELQPPSS